MTLNQTKKFALLRAIYGDHSTAQLAINRELGQQRADDSSAARHDDAARHGDDAARRDAATQTILARFGVNANRAMYPKRFESRATVLHLQARGIDVVALMGDVTKAWSEQC